MKKISELIHEQSKTKLSSEIYSLNESIKKHISKIYMCEFYRMSNDMREPLDKKIGEFIKDIIPDPVREKFIEMDESVSTRKILDQFNSLEYLIKSQSKEGESHE